MRIGKMWSVGLAVLLAVGGAARAQSSGEHRGPTSGTQAQASTGAQTVGRGAGGASCRFTLWMWRAGSRRCSSCRVARACWWIRDRRIPETRRRPGTPSRIAAVCKLAGVTKIDNLVVTHYHSDHVGGLPQLVGMVPVGRFIDHGVNRESSGCAGRLVDDCGIRRLPEGAGGGPCGASDGEAGRCAAGEGDAGGGGERGR